MFEASMQDEIGSPCFPLFVNALFQGNVIKVPVAGFNGATFWRRPPVWVMAPGAAGFLMHIPNHFRFKNIIETEATPSGNQSFAYYVLSPLSMLGTYPLESDSLDSFYHVRDQSPEPTVLGTTLLSPEPTIIGTTIVTTDGEEMRRYVETKSQSEKNNAIPKCMFIGKWFNNNKDMHSSCILL